MAKGAPDSRRWTHFHSALQLAINRAAHKWTHEDFQECFALWCKEEPHGAEGIFNTISRHMEDQIHASCETLFKDFNVKDNINILHAVVTEARARRQRGETNAKDLWRENLEPRTAVRARTVPALELELERLKATLKSLEDDNVALYDQTQKSVQRQREADEKTAELLKILDDVYLKWSKLPHDEMGLWTLQAAENLASAQPP
ncbi:hypothetical protein HYDPIDRAFT_111015 [Hydnomerulius pinastri MD-312]|uniref:Uncharacterized protein n=1 Tax=Hydnomerulius pinastri MD-312 TaxID=994086 RepID=A0A0C9WAT3_9AGAM|nr:hypothetical protein HYDPIDRAFT_111015 [Hydnomerulius pinastri MD-312]